MTSSLSDKTSDNIIYVEKIMHVYAISDLHLSINNPKPMNIFGPVWDNYIDEIVADWKSKVGDDDIVLMAGDFSWAMKTDEAQADFDFISTLPGKKIMIRGNHDYWWQSLSTLRKRFPDIVFLQNDAVRIGKYIFCGSRGWIIPEGKFNTEQNKALYDRELIRQELALTAGDKLRTDGDEKFIVMIHYPPFLLNRMQTQLTKMYDSFRVDKVVFGHLHNEKSTNWLKNTINGIDYYLTSCDMVGNKLVLID